MGEIPEVTIATLSDVREYGEGDPVELWVRSNGRVVIRAWNECGNNCTDVDLFDLLDWAQAGVVKSADGRNSLAALPTAE